MAGLRLFRADDVGLLAGLPGRQLASVVAGMSFLAALAGAGTLAASTLAGRWRQAAAQAAIVQVPRPAEPAGGVRPAGQTGGSKSAEQTGGVTPAGQASGVTREAAVGRLLGTGARLLSQAEVEARLLPWLGEDAGRLGAGLPAVFVLRAALPAGTEARLDQAAPGASLSRGAAWQMRLLELARSLVACFWLVLAVVGGVAAVVVAIVTRAGLAARRDAAEILHGLGATDGMLAGRLAGHVGLLALAGAAVGALAAVPLLLAVARLTAPFHPASAVGLAGLSGQAEPFGMRVSLPPRLWLLLATLPLAASAVGWTTAQASVRTWLRRLP